MHKRWRMYRLILLFLCMNLYDTAFQCCTRRGVMSTCRCKNNETLDTCDFSVKVIVIQGSCECRIRYWSYKMTLQSETCNYECKDRWCHPLNSYTTMVPIIPETTKVSTTEIPTTSTITATTETSTIVTTTETTEISSPGTTEISTANTTVQPYDSTKLALIIWSICSTIICIIIIITCCIKKCQLLHGYTQIPGTQSPSIIDLSISNPAFTPSPDPRIPTPPSSASPSLNPTSTLSDLSDDNLSESEKTDTEPVANQPIATRTRSQTKRKLTYLDDDDV